MSISESRVLQLALEHLESKKRDLDAEIAELKSRQGNNHNNNGSKRRGRPRRLASGANEVSRTKPEPQPKRKMSAAHRTAIAEAMKKRWAERQKESGKVGQGH